MPIKTKPFPNMRVSYQDMANPRRAGTVAEVKTDRWGTSYRVTWDTVAPAPWDTVELDPRPDSWSDLGQFGWDEITDSLS